MRNKSGLVLVQTLFVEYRGTPVSKTERPTAVLLLRNENAATFLPLGDKAFRDL
jgi:hypothetical protein